MPAADDLPQRRHAATRIRLGNSKAKGEGAGTATVTVPGKSPEADRVTLPSGPSKDKSTVWLKSL